jgi:hypothetical protein
MYAEPVQPGDFAEIRELLRSVFGELDERKFSDEFLHWKLLEPHPFFTGSRGFLRRTKDGQPAAYGALVPLRFLACRGASIDCVPAGHIIDWASSRRVPGAGIRIYQHIAAEAGVIIGIGGSRDTQQILPKIGATVRTLAYTYTHIVRPWTRTARADKDWKTPARLARDLRYSIAPPSPPPRWTMRPVEHFSTSDSPVMPQAGTAAVISERTPEVLNYWLACPGAAVRGFLLEKSGRPAGYFLTSLVGCAARIVDCWTPEERDWQAAYLCAFQQARGLPGAETVSLMVTSPPEIQALAPFALLKNKGTPVFMLDPHGKIPAGLPLRLSMADYDEFYA